LQRHGHGLTAVEAALECRLIHLVHGMLAPCVPPAIAGPSDVRADGPRATMVWTVGRLHMRGS
jgi:hypothetical protein